MNVRTLIAAATLAACSLGFAKADDAWRGVPILMYHKIDAKTPSDAVGKSLTIDPKAFDAQLTWLDAHRISTLTSQALVDALHGGKRPEHTIVLTFDDGYEDAYTGAFPLLKKHHAVASFYVSADFTGTPNHLTWKQMREMQAAGMEIACHGSRHLDLTTLNANEKQYEIGHCASALQRWLGTTPKTYVYAAGRYDAATISTLITSGFEAALTEHPGVVTSLNNPFELPRRRVDRSDAIQAFASSATP